MQITVTKCSLVEIKHLRVLFLQEANIQFIYDKCHRYGWADTYACTVDGVLAGYGSVWGRNKREDRDAIFEFYLIKPYQQFANAVFPKFITACGAPYMECQSNEELLSSMLFEYAKNINTEAVLFEDHYTSALTIPGTQLMIMPPEKDPNPDNRQYSLEWKDQLVAEGGFMLNYNMPYADIYMDVKEEFRQKGFGSFIVQELKKEIYKMGRVPAARCNVTNKISKATLLKSGFKVCGFLLNGEIKSPG